MKAKDIIHLIDQNIAAIRTSDNKADTLITLLEGNTPRFNVRNAIYGSSEDFFESLSAMTDITPSVISCIREYANGTAMKYYPINSASVSDAEEINDTLEYIYKILEK